MKCTLRSGSSAEVSSVLEVMSELCAGVKYRIRRVSFAGRLELLRAVQTLSRKAEFHSAGEHWPDKVSAATAEREIELLQLEWGLAGVEGLFIDGQEATKELFITRAPEELASEVLRHIQGQLALSGEERKN